MTRRAFVTACGLPSDGVITPPVGQTTRPSPVSGGHKKHSVLAANAADLWFSAGKLIEDAFALLGLNMEVSL